ncbi:MAG: glycosyltransferase family 2 protein [Hyphomicrobiales bacterium]
MARADILLPTYERPLSLVMTLAGVAAQSLTDLHLVVAEQSARTARDEPVVQALLRVIEARGGSFEWHHRAPRHGIAEQRQFLLERAAAPAVLYLDDDVFMEPNVLEELLRTLHEHGCGFVGAFPAGLSFRDDHRPAQEHIEFWDGPVQPEAVEPGSPEWERWQLHRAANLYHVARSLPPGRPRPYKVAWVASCVLYDRAKLLEVGGFSFWERLPRYHSGEEVVVQNLLMRRYGGCGIVPSGTYHAELPSTVLNAAGGIDGHALDLLPGLVRGLAAPAER